MGKLLKDPKKRTMVLAAGAGGVLLLMLLLRKKPAASQAGGETGVGSSVGGINPSTGIPYAQELAASQGGGGGYGGGGASSNGLESAISQLGLGQRELAQALVTSNQETQSLIARQTQAESEAFQASNNQLNTLGTSLQQLMSTGLSSSPTATSATPGPAPANSTKGRSPSQPPPPKRNTQTNNPRQGLQYTDGTYKGKKAHIYQQSVSGGVGPKKNIIIL